MKKQLLVLAMAATILSACGGKSDSNGNNGKNKNSANSVNADGTCTAAFVSDFNAVSNAAQDFKTKEDRAVTTGSPADQQAALKALEGFVGACDTFFGQHDGASCLAQDRASGRSETVTAASRKEACDAGRGLLSTRRTPRSTPMPTPTPAPTPTRPVSVDRDGNCTPAFVADYAGTANALQDLITKLQRAQTTGSTADFEAAIAAIQPAVLACDSFEKRHPAVSCKASGGTGEVVTANSSDLKGACDQVRELDKEVRSTGGSSTSMIQSIGNSIAVESLAF